MIKIKSLRKSFGDHLIFDDLSLEIADKEFVVFTGTSGCGKTTLLNMIGGIEPVDAGRILVDDIEITKSKNLRSYYLTKVGFLFQNFALVERKTVEQNLKMIPIKAQSGISVSEALEKVGMTGTEKKPIYSLSGGEQQRIALARLMVKKCSLILSDEPTGSLDAANAEKVMDILSELNQMGKTVIMVTHDVKYHDFGNRQIQIEALKNNS